tara:strand:+ start:882 stop:1310 length:429 start_codon:yes stop_codon:yes gene_type:complete
VILNKLLRNKCSVRRGDDDDVVIKMNEIALVYFSSSKRRNMKVVASLCSLFSNFRTSSLSFPLSFFLSLSLKKEKSRTAIINEEIGRKRERTTQTKKEAKQKERKRGERRVFSVVKRRVQTKFFFVFFFFFCGGMRLFLVSF